MVFCSQVRFGSSLSTPLGRLRHCPTSGPLSAAVLVASVHVYIKLHPAPGEEGPHTDLLGALEGQLKYQGPHQPYLNVKSFVKKLSF